MLLIFISPVNVETPITFKVFVLTSAVLTPVIPVSCEPSPVYAVAATVPVTVTPDAEVSNRSVLLCFRTALPPFVNAA